MSRYSHPLLTPIQMACQTKLTREGARDMTNRKPYRTKAQKRLARAEAWKTKGGFWRTIAPVSHHY